MQSTGDVLNSTHQQLKDELVRIARWHIPYTVYVRPRRRALSEEQRTSNFSTKKSIGFESVTRVMNEDDGKPLTIINVSPTGARMRVHCKSLNACRIDKECSASKPAAPSAPSPRRSRALPLFHELCAPACVSDLPGRTRRTPCPPALSCALGRAGRGALGAARASGHVVTSPCVLRGRSGVPGVP